MRLACDTFSSFLYDIIWIRHSACPCQILHEQKKEPGFQLLLRVISELKNKTSALRTAVIVCVAYCMTQCLHSCSG